MEPLNEQDKLIEDLKSFGYDVVVGYDEVKSKIKSVMDNSTEFTHPMTTKAQIELDLLDKDDMAYPYTDMLWEFISKFAHRSGDSGNSINFTARRLANVLEKLLLQQSLQPLTFDESEWTEINRDSDGIPLFQNKRSSNVFKEGINGRPYVIDGIIFKSVENDWDQFTGEVCGLRSKCYFTKEGSIPKKFFIGVKVVECEPTEDNRWYEPTDVYPFIHKYVFNDINEVWNANMYYDIHLNGKILNVNHARIVKNETA